MKLTPEIIESVSLACVQSGNKKIFAEAIGVHPSCVGRWLDGSIKKVDDSTWERLYPHIRRYLKETKVENFPTVEVFDVSGALIGAWPVMVQGADMAVLIEDDPFVEGLRPNSLAALGKIESGGNRGDLICSASAPFIFSRYGVPLPTTKPFRRVLTVVVFLVDSPRDAIRRCGEMKK